mmetsp:Transcript_34456/g.83373  ORF Transcript_34456/g.83373 Transcript_34456/m.83373 type:complete len:150 (-) Transcript_34456:337-786(-)|eukprot:CAMPEP_0181115234 /NCGR_PEP_ID=MMETSP1071-20121207/21323_1 /TAXON_ID=35127 /ORGANISM="Thalassiosira sp., Strain NH16" /LENGTH=149 /DNA_ID=CAMNT_0023199427 /DNA_START=13 /DNA_END=462 /DNA_ORIENTATION=-
MTQHLDISPDELSRFLCPNPYSCGGASSPSDRPPTEAIQIFGESLAFLPEIAAGRTLTLLSCCNGCNKLAVRSLNISCPVRVLIDHRRMMETPGVSINPNGRHPNMFADAMLYANQQLGVRGFSDFNLCGGEFPTEQMNNTFEVVNNQG